MRKVKILSTLLITTVVVSVFIFINKPVSSSKVTATPIINEVNSETEPKDEKHTSKEVTPQNYQDALQEYKKEHPEKINPDRPTEILESFMDEYNLETLETCNY